LIGAIPKERKGIQVTSVVSLRAFADRTGLPFTMPVDRQEYLPRLRRSAGAVSGTDATLVDSSANRPRNEMIFEHFAPSCYLCSPFSVLLEQSASASQALYEQDLYEQALDEIPAEDMHRAVLKISRVYAEICETAERIVASSPRELDHGKAADGMSAGG
jgi:hypothetical protein